MNIDRLRLDLADLAAEVAPVDLRDRALNTSRRLGIQRAVATSAAALVLLGAATGTAFAFLPRTGGGPAPAGTPTATEAATAQPFQSPSTSASPVSPTPATTIDGTLYYLRSTSQASVIHAVRGGVDTVVATVPNGGGRCVSNSITVAPDGKHLAWVRGRGGAHAGTLVFAAADGSGEREILGEATCLGSNAIAWVGGGRLMVRQGSRSILIDVLAGTPVPGDPGNDMSRIWSADGKYLAALDEGGKPYVTRYGGGGERRYYTFEAPADQASKYDGWGVRSVSANGRYVSVGWVGTDPSRRTDSWAVVDTTNSAVVKLPVIGQISSIHFTANGRVLVRQPGQLVLLDADFEVIAEIAEPRGVRDLALLTYVP